jgi:flagella basal body P-ring formation protein FlgA
MKPARFNIYAIAALVSAALIFMTGAAFAAEFSVELPAVIEARDGSFYLGEYASIEGGEALAAAASMAVINPKNGSFGVSDVINALGGTAAAGREAAIRMSEAVRVEPESPVAAELRARTSWKWRIDVTGDEEAKAGAKAFTVPPAITPGVRSLTIKLISDEGHKSSKQIKVVWYQPVVCSEKALERNDRLSAANLRERIGTTGMVEPLAWSAEQLNGVTLRRDVAAGEAIGIGDAGKTAVVKMGTNVKLVSNVNGLGIEVNGVAMQRGGIGDVIRVKNLSSKKVLTGRVIDTGRVFID